jgi:hypothetical protein
MTVSATSIREQIETDLSPSALQTLIDAAYAEVEQMVGPIGSSVYEMMSLGHYRIHLPRRASGVIQVEEGNRLDALSLVEASTYSLLAAGFQIVRHTQPWAYWTRTTYLPLDDTALRDGVVTDLVKAAIQYMGLTSESVGDYSAALPSYTRERNLILSRMLPSVRGLA